MNILPLVFLLVIVFPITAKPVSECPVQRCRHDGPLIQFPFRLQHSPRHCGHPEFEVSCSSFSNMTMMKLSASSGFFRIQTIDYERQQFRVSDQDGCLPGRLLNFTLSFSLFQPPRLTYDYCVFYVGSNYEHEKPLSNLTILKCTTAQNLSDSITEYSFDWKYKVIKCLSVPGKYQVLAATLGFTTADLPVDIPCSTYLSADPFSALLPVVLTQMVDNTSRCELDTGLLLEWRERRFPECQNCKGPCYFNYSSNPVLKCDSPNPKGHASTTFIVMAASVCGFVLLSTTALAILCRLKQSKRREEKENRRKIEKFRDDHKSHVPEL